MKTRPPLNGLQPRTEREAAQDPYDWIEHAEADGRSLDRWMLALAIAVALMAVVGFI